MIFKIPEYVGDATHDLTDWFVFSTDNTSNKEDAVFSVTGDPKYKNVVNITIDIPQGETYYLLAHMYLSDGSTLITKPLPIIHTDMDGKKVHGMSYGVEIPTITVVSNAYKSGGDIVIKTGKIRPKDNVLKQQTIVVTDEYGVVLDFDIVDTYEYTIDRESIINDTKFIHVFAAHQDYTFTSSLFGRVVIEVSDTNIGLLNDHLMPMYDYKPLFSNTTDSVYKLTVSENGRIVFEGGSAFIPRGTLKFDGTYRMIVTFKNSDGYVTEEFILYTTKRQSVDYLPEYPYEGYSEVDDFIIPDMNNGYAEVTGSNLIGYIRGDELITRYFNNPSKEHKFTLSYPPLDTFESRNIADDIIYLKYKTENGFAVVLVNIGVKYTIPTIVSSREITDSLDNDCILTTDDTIIYLAVDPDDRINIVSIDNTTGDKVILSVIPEEYTVEGDIRDGYEGFFNRVYSMLHVGNELLIMNSNIGVFSFDLLDHDYKYVFSINDEDKGKSFFGLQLHDRKLMYINSNSVVYVYDFDTDETEVEEINNMDNVINLLSYKVFFKNTDELIAYQ